MAYIVTAGSAAGPAHLRAGRPCEDRFAIRYSDDGWISAVVSDGCGSVKHPGDGASFISDYAAARLLELAPMLARRGLGEWVYGPVVAIFGELRDEMRQRFGRKIGDYAATIVAALIGGESGIFIHIGDGAAASFRMTAEGRMIEDGGDIGLTPAAQSNPENGEYVNETYYVTDPSWLKHLRITPVQRADCVLLCTDGAQPLFYERGTPLDHVVAEVLKEVHRCGEASSRRLEELLRDDPAAMRSDDDKTVILMVSDAVRTRLGSPVAPSSLPPRPPEPPVQCAEPDGSAVAASPVAVSPVAVSPVAAPDRAAAYEAGLIQLRDQLARTRRRLRLERLTGAILFALIVAALLGYARHVPIGSPVASADRQPAAIGTVTPAAGTVPPPAGTVPAEAGTPPPAATGTMPPVAGTVPPAAHKPERPPRQACGAKGQLPCRPPDT
jgi:hypothetical protein